MSRLVKVLGTGIGLASEAIYASRERSSSNRASLSRNASDCPEYVEVDEDTADELVRSGKAERVDTDDEKKSKAREAGYDLYRPSSENDWRDRGLAEDEAAWELDDMAEEVKPPTYEASQATAMTPTSEEPEEIKVKKQQKMVQRLVQMAGPPPQPSGRIPCPVIIPQRRPGKKDRGFVRAYAPVLDNCGISQDVFIQFISDFDKASKASPWLDVVFIAAGIAGFAPSIAAQVVSLVAQVTAGTARELQSRHRQNSFLDRVNQELLMPRGLFALVMAFKEDIPGQQSGLLGMLSQKLGKSLFSSETLDLNQTIVKYSASDPAMSKLKKGMNDMRLTSGNTYGQLQLPEAAPLVYPDLDRVAAQALEGNDQGKGKQPTNTREKLRSAGSWVQDYFDRRGQALYEAEHQGSALAVPTSERPAFKSRFSDPNHPANNGSLTSLITGGAISQSPRKMLKNAVQSQQGDLCGNRGDGRGILARGASRPRKAQGSRGGSGGRPIKKIFQQDVLYLMVVNLPTDEEIKASVAQLEQVAGQVIRV
ncbi:hypothetical protein N7468_007387 [Penicillium chermesinum]|uniref:FAD binding domain protein n=1 Tax=Penicillium chermesinum TaxID=63820 RepID=A0A9W9NU20_9EURO|nr:uncharacterized protein N7468_007387 [Penicillium chermesinum]KAJ5226162.1 hypothetical protein N7468_007387 [Penicillium chermesinum]KAJ6160654.1 hypothetical protein N7470_004050 [Penicillium chermesinum]